jgi:hypothetical protein
MNTINNRTSQQYVPPQAPTIGQQEPLNLPLSTDRVYTLIINGDNRHFGGNQNKSLSLQELASFGNKLGQTYNYYANEYYTNPNIQNNAQVRDAWAQALGGMAQDLTTVNVLGSHWQTLVGKSEFSVNDLISLANRDKQWWDVSNYDVYGRAR